MRLPYEPAKTILIITFAWALMAIGRNAGIMVVKPQFVTVMKWADKIVVSIFIMAAFYIFVAIIHNAMHKSHLDNSSRNPKL